MSIETVTDDLAASAAVSIALHVAPGSAVGWTVRSIVDAEAFGATVQDVLASFRTMSDAKGMLMTDREIRDNCWAPMLAKLVDGAIADIGETFKDRTLGFLVWVAFGDDVRNGDVVDIFVAADRDVMAIRRPGRIFRRNRYRVGRLPMAQD